MVKLEYFRPEAKLLCLEMPLSILDSFSGNGVLDQFEDGGEINADVDDSSDFFFGGTIGEQL